MINFRYLVAETTTSAASRGGHGDDDDEHVVIDDHHDSQMVSQEFSDDEVGEHLGGKQLTFSLIFSHGFLKQPLGYASTLPSGGNTYTALLFCLIPLNFRFVACLLECSGAH